MGPVLVLFGLLEGDDIVVGDGDVDDIDIIVDATCASEVGVGLGNWVLDWVPSTPRLWMSRSRT